jgi:chromosome partitioning protein
MVIQKGTTVKILAYVNNKGGVGKTKLLILLIEYLCRYRKDLKILAIDFDAQCNLSRRYLEMDIDPRTREGLIPPIHPSYDPNDKDDTWQGRSSIADIFFGEVVEPYTTRFENLDILPGHADKLLSAEAVRRSEVIEKVHNQLKKFLAYPELQEEYDIVLIDTSPSKGPLTASVVRAASHIVIPAVMEEQSVQGIYGMLQLWMQESITREGSRPLDLIGILPNMFKANTSLHQDMLRSLRENVDMQQFILPMQIGNRIVFAETDSDYANPKSVFDYSENNEARIEAMAACEYIVNRIFNNEQKKTVRRLAVAE